MADLRNFDTIKEDERVFMSFSIFKMCDNDTNKLIVTLAKLAKGRIYKVLQRTNPMYNESEENELESPFSSATKERRKKASGMQKGSSLEK